MLCGPIVNLTIRKLGTHVPMYTGAILFSGGFIAASFATKFWHLVLTQGVLVGYTSSTCRLQQLLILASLGVGFAWLPVCLAIPRLSISIFLLFNFPTTRITAFED
jgi:hypothetical protein